jgi:apolipoprotein D and lipocalin family protein
MLTAIARWLWLVAGVVALGALACTSPGCGSAEPLDVAPSVDLSRIQGKWYEIARLPRTTQNDCNGTTAFYTQNADGSLTFVNQCNVGGPNGPLNTVAMSATVPDTSVPAKLALDVGGYTGDYWILEVGSNYEYAVVGHPSRLYLWVLSRTPTLEADTLQGVVARAQSNHFDTTQLVYTPQPPGSERESAPGPVGSVPPVPTTGCSVGHAAPSATRAGRAGRAGGVWRAWEVWTVGLIAAAMALRSRRRRSGEATPIRP